jgi:SAM-dependent methyltransferase
MASREEMSTSFGAMASTYETGRPEYPVDAVAWMLELVSKSAPLRVADVGAGTGKLTRVVVGLGAEVAAIDPDAAMLAELAARVPGVPTFVGTGEKIPLPDASVDAVLFGQAWHWVDADAASREVGRVLRPGGVLGLIWNVRDERVDWVQRLTTIMHGSAAEKMIADGGPRVTAPLGALETRTWEWVRPITRDDFVALAASRSYIITAPEADRTRILTEVAALFDARANGAERIDLPYRTEAFRSVRP